MLDTPARPVPAATATATAPSSCTEQDADVKISHLVPPVFSEAMRERHKAGVVDVTVYLTADGTISKGVVSLSSGDDLLDAATYAAAMATTYEPEVKSCTYLAGTYIFRARFRAEPRTAGDVPGPAATEKPPFAPSSPSPQSTPAPAH